jgi:AcrR family transcriptional regulator
MYFGNDEARESIIKSTLKLMERAPFENISVTRIAEVADVSKRVFFQVFESKEEILNRAIDEMLGDFAAKVGHKSITSICDATELFFAFFRAYRHELRLYVNNDKTYIIQRRCQEFLLRQEEFECHFEGTRDAGEEAYAVTFFVSGMVGLLDTCIQEDSFSDEKSDELAQLVCRITNSCNPAERHCG